MKWRADRARLCPRGEAARSDSVGKAASRSVPIILLNTMRLCPPYSDRVRSKIGARSNRRTSVSRSLAHQAGDPTVLLVEERFEPGGIVRHDRADDRWPFRQCSAPCRHLRHGFEQAEVDKTLEGIEIAEHRSKHHIDETEPCAREIGTGRQRPLDLLELVREH